MTALSAIVTRVCAEINDPTNNTFSASITGTLYSELQSYAVDGIKDYSSYVYREIFDQSTVTSANIRSYVVSSLVPAPEVITRVEYAESSTSLQYIPEVELWDGTMYLYSQDKPLFTDTAGNYFNIWYLARHDVPSAGSAQLTVPAKDEELIVNYAKSKALYKFAIDQRGINQDSAVEFMNVAREFERRYKEGLKRSTTTFTSYRG